MTARLRFTAAILALLSSATMAATPAPDPSEAQWLSDAQDKLKATYQNLTFE